MRVTNELESLYLILTIRLFGSSIIILIEFLEITWRRRNLCVVT